MADGSPGYGARLLGALVPALAAALFAGALVGWLLTFAAARGVLPGAAPAYRAWLAAGGWLKLPLTAAALAALVTLRRAATALPRALTVGLVLLLGIGALWVRTADLPTAAEPLPHTARAKERAILRWSYRTPETVLEIVRLSRDPDAAVREQAVLALGVNVVVTDIEHASVTRPSRFAASPVRDSLRARLLQCLDDSAEGVRAEAARALWKAPRTLGVNTAAADTLAAILDRARDPRRPERLAWLALDAAAGVPNDRLLMAARRFARTTDDPQLARYAHLAAGETP